MMSDVTVSIKMNPQQAGKLYMHREQLIEEVEQLKDLVRFLSETWVSIDKFVYKNCTGEQLMQYPVIQGTRNQVNLKRIGEQEYKTENLRKAVSLLLGKNTKGKQK